MLSAIHTGINTTTTRDKAIIMSVMLQPTLLSHPHTLPQSMIKQSQVMLQHTLLVLPRRHYHNPRFNTHDSAFHRHNPRQSNDYASDAATHMTQPSTDATTIHDKARTTQVMLQHTSLSLPQTQPQSMTKQWLHKWCFNTHHSLPQTLPQSMTTQVIINTHYPNSHPPPPPT